MGVRGHRHAFRRLSSAGSRADTRREAGRRGVRARVTGVCPTVALHVQWDLPGGRADVERVSQRRARGGRRAWRDQPELLSGSGVQARFVRARRSRGAPPGARARPRERRDRRGARQPRRLVLVRRRIELSGHREHPRTQALVRGRPSRDARAPRAGSRLLVEYKPFEPAFYHTDIADWGMALLLARARRTVGPGARRYRTPLRRRRTSSRSSRGSSPRTCSAGFHFNDRRYADDDLTIGSIDPYQVFRIFHEIGFFEWEAGARPTSRSSSTRATT